MARQRELIDTGTDKRFVRRDEQGRFTESVWGAPSAKTFAGRRRLPLRRATAIRATGSAEGAGNTLQSMTKGRKPCASRERARALLLRL
jgi:hypothetical protein